MKHTRRKFIRQTGLGVLALGAMDVFGTEMVFAEPFANITYEASDEIFANPERGFFPQLAVNSERPGLDIERLKTFRNEHMTLMLRIFYLEKFKDRDLSEAQLALMRSDLQKVREAGLKTILRFAYTNNMEVADAPLHIVERHLDQLKPIFEENKDIIAFVQAGFIGAWGEWHASSNGLATTENQRKVLFKILSVLPAEIMVQVRTPGQKQRIFGTTTPIGQKDAFTTANIARTGHHNDCFLATDTDYGTYSENNIAGEKQYISDEALYVPTGGETCPPVPKENLPGCEYSLQTMKHLRWTYLHLNYYRPTVNGWKEAGCFDDLQRNLGYRLALTKAVLPEEVRTDRDIPLNISLSNLGYAPLYHQKITSLVLKNRATGTVHDIRIPIDIRHCKPEATLTINDRVSTKGIPRGSYDLYLKITDKDGKLKDRPEYSIRLANRNVWDGSMGINNLKHTIRIV